MNCVTISKDLLRTVMLLVYSL